MIFTVILEKKKLKFLLLKLHQLIIPIRLNIGPFITFAARLVGGNKR